MTTRIPAFNSMPHDFDLSLAICRRSRSDIIETSKIFDDTDIQKVYEDTETEYIELMKKCGTLILKIDYAEKINEILVQEGLIIINNDNMNNRFLIKIHKKPIGNQVD
ncbi:unnamed protein product [Rhizophagus irregularis]|nr:unnamed protein product [Rhizophagus irregularis]